MRSEPIIQNSERIPLEFRKGFNLLAKKIPGLVQVTILDVLSGGFSGAVPLSVYAIYEETGSYQVIKIGNKEKINREAQNWDHYIKNAFYQGLNIIHLKQHIRGSKDSLIIYNLIGNPTREVKNFKILYEHNKNPEEVLNFIFGDIFRLQNEAKKTEFVKVSKILSKINPASRTQIIKEGKKILKGYLPKKLKINGSELINPLCFFPFDNSRKPVDTVIPVFKCITHGDLNAKNILFYQTGAFKAHDVTLTNETVEVPCIIDYADMEKDSIFTDLATLEAVLKFQLLDVNNLSYSIFEFEEKNIIRAIELSDTPPVKTADLQKLFSCIKKIRYLIKELINKGCDQKGYWLELYVKTLMHLKYRELSEKQKRYALFSAALILKRFF